MQQFENKINCIVNQSLIHTKTNNLMEMLTFVKNTKKGNKLKGVFHKKPKVMLCIHITIEGLRNFTMDE